MNMKRKKLWIIIVAVALIVLLVVPMAMTGMTQISGKQEYERYEVQEINISQQIAANGNVEAAELMIQRIQGGVKIDTVDVERGERILQGDVIATLDAEILHNRVDLLRSQLAQIEEDLDDLDDGDFAANPNAPIYDQAVDFFDEDIDDVSRYIALRGQRTEVRRQLQALDQYIEKNAVCSDVDGVISEVYIANGMQIPEDGSAQIDMILMEAGAYCFVAQFDELDIAGVSAGQSAAIVLDALPDTLIEAKVKGISRLSTRDQDGVKYAVTLEMQPDEHLRIGMSGKSTIVLETKSSVKALPLAAIQEDDQGAYVEMQSGDTLIRIPIETGFSDGTTVEIIGELQIGDVVVKQIAQETSGGMASFLPPMPGGM